jgi:hypothetical protein
MATEGVCDHILSSARQFDAAAKITSVSRRDADDGILVRLAAQKDKTIALTKALRAAWPLASVSTVENLVNGHTEAQVLLPSESEQQEIAKSLAHNAPLQRPLRLLANALMVLLAIACALKLVEISRD